MPHSSTSCRSNRDLVGLASVSGLGGDWGMSRAWDNRDMARAAERLSENAAGPFFVDSTCIDCGACRIVAPHHFRRGGSGLSIVHRQPETDAERTRALMALVACPTSSIGTEPRRDATAGVAAFPELLDEEAQVYFCGFTAASSFGATCYLVRRPEGN